MIIFPDECQCPRCGRFILSLEATQRTLEDYELRPEDLPLSAWCLCPIEAVVFSQVEPAT